MDQALLNEVEKVRSHLLDRYMAMGFEVHEAECLVFAKADWHMVERMILNGCTHELAVAILT